MAFGVKVLADFAKNGRIKRAWGASYSLNIRALPHTKQNLPSCSFFVPQLAQGLDMTTKSSTSEVR
jgi:hypothetical protein